jgi:hypothetical protein
MTLWTKKTGLQGGLGDKRSRLHWMSEDSMLLQLDSLDHHFEPEGQAPTLWARTSWSTGSEGRFQLHAIVLSPLAGSSPSSAAETRP